MKDLPLKAIVYWLETLRQAQSDKFGGFSKAPIKYHSEARKEFFAISEYYEEQVVGLGDEFIHEVEKVLDVIKQYPSTGNLIMPNERRFLVSRFPYGIIYSAEGKSYKNFCNHGLEAQTKLLRITQIVF